mgnify:CR=1 FL=1
MVTTARIFFIKAVILNNNWIQRSCNPFNLFPARLQFRYWRLGDKHHILIFHILGPPHSNSTVWKIV